MRAERRLEEIAAAFAEAVAAGDYREAEGWLAVARLVQAAAAPAARSAMDGADPGRFGRPERSR